MVKTTNIIASMIHHIRGQRVMLDSDLAKLYGVTTERLNQQCKRNLGRFPDDFRFQLIKQEFASLTLQNASSNMKSQNATSSSRGGRRYYLPYAFTEHGAIMAANVLKSKQAVETSVNIVRAFVRIRLMIVDNSILEKKILKMESEYDDKFKVVFQHLRQLILEPPPPKRKIGFIIDNKKHVG